MKIRYLLIFLILAISMGCQQKTEMPFTDHHSTIKEIRDMLENYHADIAKEGLTAEFPYLDSSSNFFWVPPGYEQALSYDSVKLILTKNALGFSSIKFHWDTLAILPLSSTIATYNGIVKGTMVDTAGHINHVSIIESGTFIKRESGWKLLSGQSAALNSDGPKK